MLGFWRGLRIALVVGTEHHFSVTELVWLLRTEGEGVLPPETTRPVLITELYIRFFFLIFKFSFPVLAKCRIATDCLHSGLADSVGTGSVVQKAYSGVYSRNHGIV